MSDFTYKNLEKALSSNSMPVVRHGNYYAMSNGGAFWQISPVDFDESKVNGWKFHLSIHPDDVSRAWDLIEERLVDEQLAAKVTNPAYSRAFANPDERQRGKMITLYDDTSRPRDWGQLLKHIDDTFEKNGVRPGPQVNIDRPVQGSRFASYRNDRDLNGHYIDSRLTTSYNQANHPDPYAALDLNRLPAAMPQASPRADTQSLNALLAPMGERYQSAQWAFDEGKGSLGRPNLRFAHPDPERTYEIAASLEAVGVPTLHAQKGRNHLLVVWPDDAKALSPESLTRAQQHLAATAAYGQVARNPEGSPAAAWQVDAGKGGVGVPNVRAYVNSADEAHQVAARVHAETGLEMAYFHKTLPDGRVQHMAVLPVREPARVMHQLAQARARDDEPTR